MFFLATSGVKKLGVLLPHFPGLPPMVAFPLVLPMGWTESPPWFCVFTETICDLANAEIHKNLRLPAHPLEAQAGTLDFAATPDASGGQDTPVRPRPNWQSIPQSHHCRIRR